MRAPPLLLVAALAVAAAAACSSSSSSGFQDPVAAPGTAGGEDGGIDAPQFGPGQSALTSIEVTPAAATLDVNDGSSATAQFQAIGHYADGSTGSVSAAAKWSLSRQELGSIAAGTFTSTGALGGTLTVTAAMSGRKATAKLTVKLRITAGTAQDPAKSALEGATNPDPSVTWAYPYNGTVFPRGLAGPELMWNGGAGADLYYVHVSGPTLDLTTFSAAPPPARLTLPAATWQRLVDSSEGPLAVTVARWDGAKATRIAQHTWSIAPQSMRGTIYYWANNLGRVMRIKPGASAPDDFANKAPLNDPNQYPASSCLMTCHTVSADGSTLISGGGSYGGSYDLLAGVPKKSLGGVWKGGQTDGVNVEWMSPALSPDGKYVLVNAMALGLSAAVNGPSGFGGLRDTATGAVVPTAGLGGLYAMPAFSPDGSHIAYVAAGDPAGWTGGWSNPNPGGLRVVDFDAKASPMASGDREVVAAGADPAKRIGWPSVSPDGSWIVYQRGASADTRGGASDLYAAPTAAGGAEVRLAALDGDAYPFAAGARDQSLNFEPTFAPVPSGGYFWVVFTSRRTYGNELTATPDKTKQLWVAAIDLAPAPGKDPSHPPFRLSGQAADSLNMRGFWALDPCKQDGQGCGTGSECCGGYCAPGDDGGALACRSAAPACAADGDRCQATSDCCNASLGVTCINRVCSEPAAK